MIKPYGEYIKRITYIPPMTYTPHIADVTYITYIYYATGNMYSKHATYAHTQHELHLENYVKRLPEACWFNYYY